MKRNFFKLFIVIILIIILSLFLIFYLTNKIMPIYLNYTEGELEKLVTTIINKSVNEEITNKLEIDNLFIIKNNDNTKTTIVDFDPVILNQVMSTISDTVYTNLKLVSEKDSETLKKYNISSNIFYIPTGMIFDSVLLNNLGPKIPINMEIISSINPDIETKVTEYGINNSLIEVFIHVIVDVRMILPISSSNIQITVVVPLTVKLIQGSVPEYYLGNFLKEKNS